MSAQASPAPAWTPQFDGPDFLSPRAEIEAELARVEAARAHPTSEWQRLDEVDRLRNLLLTATDKGGFSRDVPGTETR